MKSSALTIPRDNAQSKCLASRLAYPLTLALNLVFIYGLYQSGFAIGNLFFIGFFVALASMAALESILPYRQDWQADGKDWAVNGLYFLINGATDNIGKIVTASLAVLFAPALSTDSTVWQFAGSALMALLVSDFIGYWWHRLGHESRILWRFHGIHHVPSKLFMFNNNTVHFVDLLAGGLLNGIVLSAFGFSAEAIALALYISSFHSFFAHVNADVRMGKLGYIMMGPEHHRFHHSTNTSEAKNYSSSTALWDHVFGTFIYRPGEAPAEIGIAGEHRFPQNHRLLASIVSPFIK